MCHVTPRAVLSGVSRNSIGSDCFFPLVFTIFSSPRHIPSQEAGTASFSETSAFCSRRATASAKSKLLLEEPLTLSGRQRLANKNMSIAHLSHQCRRQPNSRLYRGVPGCPDLAGTFHRTTS